MSQLAEFLPHLPNEVIMDARGPELDAFMVALEGWRRGLTLKWYTNKSDKFPSFDIIDVDSPGKLFSLGNGNKTHYFFSTRGDLAKKEAVAASMDIQKAKSLLQGGNVTVADGKLFIDTDQETEIIKYANTIGYPVVVKPFNRTTNRRVLRIVENVGRLKDVISFLKKEPSYKGLTIEKHLEGDSFRLYVIDNEVKGALQRIPANVTGDGIHSIKQLIELKNRERKQNPFLENCLIEQEIDMVDHLKKNGFSFNSIPTKDEQVTLTSNHSINYGGDPIDVLDTISEEMKEEAIKAVKAFPELQHASIDIVVYGKNLNESKYVITDINATPSIAPMLFPVSGVPRDIPSAIVDYYFPETTVIKTEKEKIYFDFVDVLEPLHSHSANVTTVSPAPVGEIHSKKFVLTGDVQQVGFHRGLRKQAFERKLSGYVSSLSNGSIEVVVSGLNEEVVDGFKEALVADSLRSDVQSISEEAWTGPVKVGFEIKADLKTQLENMKKLTEQKDQLIKDLKYEENIYRLYMQSISWRMTQPLRKIGDSIKSFRK
ncbi:acylphosphatase [Sutcliffiella horikoshii]|uniref:acylphosphatase n=1 Tax=Sutcliffiella horikoshii TaxID=79883 RepID=UPI003850461C